MTASKWAVERRVAIGRAYLARCAASIVGACSNGNWARTSVSHSCKVANSTPG